MVAFPPKHLVATDGHRIAVYPFECDIPDQDGVIIPTDSVQLIHKHVDNDCSAQLVYVQGSSNINMLGFKSDSFDLYCKLIDSKYPSWQNLTPSHDNQHHHISIDKVEMQAALQRLSLYEPLFDMENTKTGIALKSNDAQDDLHTEVDSKNDFSVALSNRYFSDALSLCTEDDKIMLHGSESDSVWMLTIDGKTETHYMMPYRR